MSTDNLPFILKFHIYVLLMFHLIANNSFRLRKELLMTRKIIIIIINFASFSPVFPILKIFKHDFKSTLGINFCKCLIVSSP